jgi:putative transcriptional regulator
MRRRAGGQEESRRSTDFLACLADLERFAREDGIDVDETAWLRYPAEYVRAVRERLKLTQGEFAKRFGLSERTIQEWEQGRAEPEGPARILLRVIDREPRAVERALRAS